VEKQLKLQRDKWMFAISQLTKETIKSTDDLAAETEVSLPSNPIM
jgi:hypothetical protein